MYYICTAILQAIMKKITVALLLLVIGQIGFSQNNQLWKGYFSYNSIKDITQAPDKLFAASENALFSDNLSTNFIKTTNTVDGLSGQTITTIYHSPVSNKTLVGYDNGLMIVINETDGKMLNVVDIINKAIPANTKKINHFMEYNGIVYVSCDFGIVQYNLNTLQFGDTYFIGDNGALIPISQTAVFEGNIYAATLNNGMRRADVNNPNLNDYNQWTTIAGGGWIGVTAFGSQLLAATTFGNIQKWQSNTFVNVVTLPEIPVDFRSTESYLVVTTPNNVYVYNSGLSPVATVNSSQIPDMITTFSCATVIDETIFIGTNDKGVITKKMNGSAFENIIPDGPIRNNIFAIDATTKNLWAVYGGYTISYNPFTYTGSPPQSAMSKFTDKGWIEIPFEDLLGAKWLSRIAINPNNSNQLFISSYYSGLLKLVNDEATNLYNAQNTGNDGLQTITGQVPDDVRINGSAFDKSNNLWVTNSLVSKGLKVLKTNGQWQSYTMSNALLNFGRLTIDKNGTKWLTTNTDGLIGFNEDYNNLLKTIKEGPDTGNLPINDARVAAIDNKNQMWIGTRRGLRVLYNVDSFLSSDQLTTEPIIIIEDGLPQELLYEQAIMDIVVDGANNKWIGTADSGVFLVSPDGQETFYHFTTGNSPLPSNVINDIDINPTTGEVFFATTKGLVSFKGTSTGANENLNNVYVYPNPVRPGFEGTVKISGLLDQATVKITDIEGNLVFETTSEGGTIEWDTTAFGKYKVASGVYMIFISAEDGVETKVKKVMIVR